MSRKSHASPGDRRGLHTPVTPWVLALLPAIVGVPVMVGTMFTMSDQAGGIRFMVAAWVAALDLLIVGGVLHRRATAHVPADDARRCRECGYDRTGTDGDCPECGSALAPRPRTQGGCGSLVLVGLGLVVAFIALTLGSIAASAAVWQI